MPSNIKHIQNLEYINLKIVIIIIIINLLGCCSGGLLYTPNSITKYCEFGEGGGLYFKPFTNFTLIKPPNFVCKMVR